MGVDCKSTSYAYAGSNPAWPTILRTPIDRAPLEIGLQAGNYSLKIAHVAQW